MFVSTIEHRSNRAAARAHVLLTATLMTPSGAVSVRIRDVSVAGAQLWAEQPVPDECDAVLKRGSFFAAARVVRSGDKSIGLRF